MKKIYVPLVGLITISAYASIDRAGNVIEDDSFSQSSSSGFGVLVFGALYAFILPFVKKHTGDESIGYYITAAIAGIGLFIVGALLR